MAEVENADDHPLNRYPHEVVTQDYRIENTIYSEHNHPVVQFTKATHRPVITCEFYSKWYSLYIWWTDGNLLRLDFHDLQSAADELGVSPYVDHVPNPAAVERYAEKMNYGIDELAQDLIRGRWHNEVV